MLDIKKLREDFSSIKSALKKRGYDIDQEKFQSLDKKRKVLQVDVENLQAEKKKLSTEFGNLKSSGSNACLSTARLTKCLSAIATFSFMVYPGN